MNLGWGLAVVPGLMDPPKGPVSKQKPRREQMQDDITHTCSQGNRRGAEGCLRRACTVESERESNSVHYLDAMIFFTLQQNACYFLRSDKETRDRVCVCVCASAHSEMLISPALTPPTAGLALLFSFLESPGLASSFPSQTPIHAPASPLSIPQIPATITYM